MQDASVFKPPHFTKTKVRVIVWAAIIFPLGYAALYLPLPESYSIVASIVTTFLSVFMLVQIIKLWRRRTRLCTKARKHDYLLCIKCEAPLEVVQGVARCSACGVDLDAEDARARWRQFSGVPYQKF